MTDLERFLFGVVAVGISVMLILGAMAYQAKKTPLEQTLSQLYVRKEELALEQSRILASIQQLNESLNLEKERNQQLASDLSELQSRPVATPVPAATPPVQPAPTKTRVTRAS